MSIEWGDLLGDVLGAATKHRPGDWESGETGARLGEAVLGHLMKSGGQPTMSAKSAFGPYSSGYQFDPGFYGPPAPPGLQGYRRHRRMNPLNVRAARRAIRRIKSVRHIAHSIERQLPHQRARAPRFAFQRRRR